MDFKQSLKQSVFCSEKLQFAIVFVPDFPELWVINCGQNVGVFEVWKEKLVEPK